MCCFCFAGNSVPLITNSSLYVHSRLHSFLAFDFFTRGIFVIRCDHPTVEIVPDWV